MINFALQKYFLSKKGLFCCGLAWRKLYRRSNNDHRNERVEQRCLRRYDTGSFLPSVVPDLNQKSFSVLFPEIVTNVSFLVCGKVSTNYCITFEFVPSLESFLDFCLCSVFLLSGGLKFLRCLLELEIQNINGVGNRKLICCIIVKCLEENIRNYKLTC